MAGNDSTLEQEIAELQQLLTQAKTPGNQRDLAALLQQKQQQQLSAQQAHVQQQQEEEAMQVDEEAQQPTILPPAPTKVGAHKATTADVGSDLTVFSEISRFGWEDDGYGKPKVSVYIMSGIDGVGDLPKEQVTCSFTKTSFDLKVA